MIKFNAPGFTIPSEPDFNAVVDKDFGFIFGGEAAGTNNESGSDNGAMRTLMAVKLGSDLPDLTSRRYKVNHIAFGFSDSGEIRLVGSRSDAKMTFSKCPSGNVSV